MRVFVRMFVCIVLSLTNAFLQCPVLAFADLHVDLDDEGTFLGACLCVRLCDCVHVGGGTSGDVYRGWIEGKKIGDAASPFC